MPLWQNRIFLVSLGDRRDIIVNGLFFNVDWIELGAYTVAEFVRSAYLQVGVSRVVL